MAALYGRLQGSRGEVTRVGHSSIEAKLETWEGSIRVVLKADGTYEVLVGGKSNPTRPVASGKVEA